MKMLEQRRGGGEGRGPSVFTAVVWNSTLYNVSQILRENQCIHIHSIIMIIMFNLLFTFFVENIFFLHAFAICMPAQLFHL